ncbi:MAG: hypothetical protein QM680_12285 [Luteolibacter sp.]
MHGDYLSFLSYFEKLEISRRPQRGARKENWRLAPWSNGVSTGSWGGLFSAALGRKKADVGVGACIFLLTPNRASLRISDQVGDRA